MNFEAVKGIMKAIFTSILTFPSCAFWGCSMSTIILFFVAEIIKLRANKFSQFPTILQLIESDKTDKHFKLAALVSSGFLIILNYYVYSYYTRSHQGSEKKVQRLLKEYLITLHFFSFLYILFFFLSTFGSEKLGFTRCITFSLFFLTHPFVHIIPKSIVRLKHNTRRLPGYSLIHMELLASLIASPLYLYCSYKGIDYGYLYNTASTLFTISYLLNGLSFVFDAISVLGHRFIKYHRYYSPPASATNSKKKVAVHV